MPDATQVSAGEKPAGIDAELLGTAGCHLCEDASAIVAMASRTTGLRWQAVDIADDDELLARYAERIPVLRHRNGELCWPFGVLDVVRLVRQDVC